MLSDSDFQAYLERIEYTGELRPDLFTLRELHFHHARRIPFENLDVVLGVPIRLDLPSLIDKLVARRRGGYCFEQNTLFAAVLQRVGFNLTKLAARVQMGSSEPRPRTHMLLKVDLAQGSHIADVGFGGEGLLYPMPLIAGHVNDVFGWQARFVERGTEFVLQSMREGNWFDLYRFTLEPQEHIDYEVANHYTSTYPESRFVLNLVAQLPGETRVILINRTFYEQRPSVSQEISVEDSSSLLRILDQHFGIFLPPDTPLEAVMDTQEKRRGNNKFPSSAR